MPVLSQPRCRSERLHDLIEAAGLRFSQHNSPIAHNLSRAIGTLDSIATSATLPAPTSVPACAALPRLCANPNEPLIAALRPALADLCWRPPGYGKLAATISSQMAVVEIVGPNGMLPHADIRFGFLAQQKGVDYPTHCHAAEELYVVLDGSAKWAVDHGPYVTKGVGDFIYHAPNQPHAIRTERTALLTLWGWSGDISAASYSV